MLKPYSKYYHYKMSAETVPQLPAIKSLHVPHGSTQQAEPELPGKESEKKEDNDARINKAASFITRVRLGSVHKQPRPGDVYRPHMSAGLGRARPLGLIPDRGERMTLLRELTQFLTPVPGLPAPFTTPVVSQTLPSISQTEKGSESLQMAIDSTKSSVPNKLSLPKSNAHISTTMNRSENNKIQEKDDAKKQEPVNGGQSDVTSVTLPISGILRTESPSPFRLHQYGAEKSKNIGHGTTFENDPDYIELLANCNIKDYYGSTSEKIESHRVHRVPQTNGTLGMEYSRRRLHTLPAEGLQWNSSPKVTKLSQSRKATQLRERSFTIEYFNFSGQAKLWNRSLMDDRREALGYLPCERCRLRGGRCAKCKAIRTGGGYIILDENDLSDDDLQRKFGNRFGYIDEGYCYGHVADDVNGGLGRSRQQSDQDGAASKGGGGDGSLMDGDNGQRFDRSSGTGHKRGGGTLRGQDGRGGRGDSGDGDGDGRDGKLGRNLASKDAIGDALDGNDGNQNREDDREGLGLDDDKNADSGGQRGDEEDSGHYSNTSGRLGSKQSGSRPASNLGSRPGSSMRKFGTRGSARDRKKKFGIEKQRGRGLGEDGDSDGSDGEERGGRRSRRRKGHGDDSDDEGDGRERADYKFSSRGREIEDDDGEAGHGSYADLMRFKKKRDDVKALHATMKELQGIDPLDYLARYCIIDQTKLPHYQHAYDNVDRDEDDEIDIAELDFALKAVNYNLITDAEMNYVHSILELAGRYKLNFRLFSLIAALSEKVVALEDMVKRLVNKMDFEALEVKLKKCKELFYLLADTESSDLEGGVVTTNSLAVELQAGGLTEEHVEFVVDRLNHEDKGIVEFLDYLTYVPLFVEIHDTISGNPLDFSRTK